LVPEQIGIATVRDAVVEHRCGRVAATVADRVPHEERMPQLPEPLVRWREVWPRGWSNTAGAVLTTEAVAACIVAAARVTALMVCALRHASLVIGAARMMLDDA
jgi:hypothetical protein